MRHIFLEAEEGSVIRGERFYLISKRTKTEMRNLFLTHQVVMIFTALPERIGDLGSIATFKRPLNKCLRRDKIGRLVEKQRGVGLIGQLF